VATRLKPGPQYVDVDVIREDPNNPRRINPERLDALRHALRDAPAMLEARPIIVDLAGLAVAGNMRHRALVDELADEAHGNSALQKALKKWGGVPVYARRFTPAERREWMLRDNASYGEWIPEEVRALVEAHQEEEQDLDLLGFHPEDMAALLGTEPDLPDSDEGGGGAGAGKANGIPHTSQWGVIVVCADEPEQQRVFERLAGEGLDARVVVT
jgi:hypothetical protein